MVMERTSTEVLACAEARSSEEIRAAPNADSAESVQSSADTPESSAADDIATADTATDTSAASTDPPRFEARAEASCALLSGVRDDSPLMVRVVDTVADTAGGGTGGGAGRLLTGGRLMVCDVGPG